MMTGPNNYGNNKMRILLDFISANPEIRREILLQRLGYSFLGTFNRAKNSRQIVASEDSTYRAKYWVVNMSKGKEMR